MCGLVGLLSLRPLEIRDCDVVRRMGWKLRHRGPDDEGYVLISANGAAAEFSGADSVSPTVHSLPDPDAISNLRPQVLLGHRRLSIIDLTPSGHQPMCDRHTGNWIVFNGEVYNYLEIRRELESRGHQFSGNSDTEVLLKSYAEWGEQCLEPLNGMWAFCIWDAPRQRLFCARDRFGEKQLYFAQTEDHRLFFASEITPLLGIAGVDRTVSDHLVWDFLVFGLADHTGDTFFRGVTQLLPGHYAIASPGGVLQTVQYYRLRYFSGSDLPDAASLAEYARSYKDLLFDSVRLRLRSDVQVGSFLSGGLDSSSVVYAADSILCSQGELAVSTPNLLTFTSCYSEPSPYDESHKVTSLLSGLSNVVHTFYATSPDEYKREMLSLIRVQEQPFHNASIFAPYKLLGEIRRRGVKVVLTGEAGDETLAGYYSVYLAYALQDLLRQGHIYRWIVELQKWGPRAAHAMPKGLLRSLPPYIRHQLYRRFRPVPALMLKDFYHAYLDRESQWSAQWRGGDLQKRLAADITQFNLPHLLRLLDRNSMASSIECRLPLLDHRLVEFVFQLPTVAKIGNGFSKYILRLAMDGVLPNSVVWDRSKIGFGHAEQMWFLSAFDVADLEGVGLEKYVDVRQLAREVSQGRASLVQDYWLPYCLGLWLAEFAARGSKSR